MPEPARAEYKRSYYLANRDRIRARAKITDSLYNAANRAKRTERQRLRESRLAKAEGYDAALVEALYQQAAKMTQATGLLYHVDHIVPLSKGGLHHQDNLVVMRADYNIRKGTKIIPELIKFFTELQKNTE